VVDGGGREKLIEPLVELAIFTVKAAHDAE
jgi:hypothetical protein